MEKKLRKNVILVVEDIDIQRYAISKIISEEFKDSMIVSVANFESAKSVIEDKDKLRILLKNTIAGTGLCPYRKELEYFGKKPLFNIACIVLDMVDEINKQMMGDNIIKLLEERRKKGLSEFIQVVLYSGNMRPEKIKNILPSILQDDNTDINEIKLYLAKEHNVSVVEKGNPDNIGSADWIPYDLFIAMYPNLRHSAEIVDKKIELEARGVMLENLKKDSTTEIKEILNSESFFENLCLWT